MALYADKGMHPEPDSYLQFALKKDSFLEVPSTGAKICRTNSRSFLNRYCQALPVDEFCKPFVDFAYDEIKSPEGDVSKYIGIATLPPLVPKVFRCVRGQKICATKDEAADEVAFEIIQKLYLARKINKYLLSTSRHGGDILFPEADPASKNFGHSFIETPLLNETKLFHIELSEKVPLFLYRLVLEPNFPYLNQENMLGFIFFR